MTTPYFLIDADRLEQNLRVLRGVMDRTGCKILLAQKCFSCYGLYPLVMDYLAGATASGIYEARLWHESRTMYEATTGRRVENHIFSPAFQEKDIDEILRICDHIVFNSPRQLALYGKRAKDAGLQIGLRINPEFSTQEGHAIYDPCAPGSRLGTTRQQMDCFAEQLAAEGSASPYTMLDGLHFHTLCEQDSDDLATTLEAVEEKFGDLLPQMKWINFGGGHHITREGYDIPRLERCIRHMQEKYGLEVIIEPGEAVALNAGTLHSTVLEIQGSESDDIRNAILDTSAACHMPDVIEMPYTPPLERVLHRTPVSDNTEHSYRFGGPTCLSGDVIGEFKIEGTLHEGDEVVFGDMAIYSMVKTNTFNGMPLPDIYIKKGEDLQLWKSFSYEDFKSRV